MPDGVFDHRRHRATHAATARKWQPSRSLSERLNRAPFPPAQRAYSVMRLSPLRG